MLYLSLQTYCGINFFKMSLFPYVSQATTFFFAYFVTELFKSCPNFLPSISPFCPTPSTSSRPTFNKVVSNFCVPKIAQFPVFILANLSAVFYLSLFAVSSFLHLVSGSHHSLDFSPACYALSVSYAECSSCL